MVYYEPDESKRKGDTVAGPLNNKRRELFCNELILDNNATKAAIRAGYAATTATMQGSRLLTFDNVKQRVAELRADRIERTSINADWVLKELSFMFESIPSEILKEDGATLRNIHEWPPHWQKMISSFEIGQKYIKNEKGEDEIVSYIKKLKWIDKHKVLQDIGKHIDVQAFQDRLKVESPQFQAFADALNQTTEGTDK